MLTHLMDSICRLWIFVRVSPSVFVSDIDATVVLNKNLDKAQKYLWGFTKRT